MNSNQKNPVDNLICDRGEYHDAVIYKIDIDSRLNFVRIFINNLQSAIIEDTQHIAPIEGAICFRGVTDVKLDCDSLSEKIRIYEIEKLSNDNICCEVVIRFSPSGSMSIKFLEIQEEVSVKKS